MFNAQQLIIFFFRFFRKRIIMQTQEANEKLAAQIMIAQNDRDQLLKKIDESNKCR